MPKKGSKKKPEEEGAVEVKKEEPDVAAAPDAVAAGVKREREEENGGGSNSKQVKAESSKVEPRCVMIVRRIPSGAVSNAVRWSVQISLRIWACLRLPHCGRVR